MLRFSRSRELGQWLTHHQLASEIAADDTCLTVPCSLNESPTTMLVKFEEGLTHFELTVPLPASPRAIDALCSAICRINNKLRLPGFHFDAPTGTLLYRVSIPADPLGLSEDTVRAVLATMLETAETHTEELARASASPASPQPKPLHADHLVFDSRPGGQPAFSFSRIPVFAPQSAPRTRPPDPNGEVPPAMSSPEPRHWSTVVGAVWDQPLALIWDPATGTLL